MAKENPNRAAANRAAANRADGKKARVPSANGGQKPGEPGPGSGRDTEQMERILSRCLQVGVLLSAAVILTGLAMFFITGSSGYPGGAFPADLGVLLSGLAALKPYAVISAGLFILILTPVFRVFISIFVFLKQKDFPFVGITALVFVILIVSFLIGELE